MDVVKLLKSAPRKHEQEERTILTTPWSSCRDGVMEPLSPTLAQLHPHPQFARNNYSMLDGMWECAIVDMPSQEEAARSWSNAPAPTSFPFSIRVPFSPESALSGLRKTVAPNNLLWYRKQFEQSAGSLGDLRLMLHFDAVDWACAVYVDGMQVGTHVGAYIPFCFDITDALSHERNQHTLNVCVFDPSDCGSQLRGKQRLEPTGMWYTAQSGIWQSVWMETVPTTRIAALRTVADYDAGAIICDLALTSETETVFIDVALDGLAVANVACTPKDAPLPSYASFPAHLPLDSSSQESLYYAQARIEIPEPLAVWSPQSPTLYKLTLTCGSDIVNSYCAFRTTTIEAEAQGTYRFMLNHQPLFLKGVLDQGYWPDGLLTAPNVDALSFDIAYAQQVGFNMLRKHIKVESDLWYYLCDVSGMLVWQDVPSGGMGWNENEVCNLPTVFASRWCLPDGEKSYAKYNANDPDYREEWTRTCEEMVFYLGNHPCIVTWVLFNEGWGQFDVEKATTMVRALDSSRPIDAASGWFDQGGGNFISEHNYFRSIKLRPQRFKKTPGRAYVISEFGGATLPIDGHTTCKNRYGYGSASTVEEWRAGLSDLLSKAQALESKGLSGFVLTQLTDVEEETNGLMTYDRKIFKQI